MTQAGIDLRNRFDVPNYKWWADQAFEKLMDGSLTTKEDLVFETKIFTTKTVPTLNNAHLATPAKVQIKQAVDVAGDHGKVIHVYGLDAAGAYQTEDIALDGANSTTAVESAKTYSAIIAAWPATTLGAQNVTIFPTGVGANVIITLAGSGNGLGGILGWTAANAGGDRLVEVCSVYNHTDDALHATNLAVTAFTCDKVYGGVLEGIAPNAGCVVKTGAGGAKTYHVTGYWAPYQGCLAANDLVEVEMDWWDDCIWFIGDGGAREVVAESAISPRTWNRPLWALPQTLSYDETAVGAVINLAGLTEASAACGVARVPIHYITAGYARPLVGDVVEHGNTAADLGMNLLKSKNQDVATGNEGIFAYGPASTGAAQRGCFLLGIGRVTEAGISTTLTEGDYVLVVVGDTSNSAEVGGNTCCDVFRLTV